MFGPLVVDVVDARSRGSLVEPSAQRGHRVSITARHGLDTAVRQVAYPAGERELACLILGRGPEANALDAATDGELSSILHASIR